MISCRLRSTCWINRSEANWLKADEKIFGKLALVDAGILDGAPVLELALVGIFEYQYVLTSHHKLAYPHRIKEDVYDYAIAGQRQDIPTLLM